MGNTDRVPTNANDSTYRGSKFDVLTLFLLHTNLNVDMTSFHPGFSSLGIWSQYHMGGIETFWYPQLY